MMGRKRNLEEPPTRSFSKHVKSIEDAVALGISFPKDLLTGTRAQDRLTPQRQRRKLLQQLNYKITKKKKKNAATETVKHKKNTVHNLSTLTIGDRTKNWRINRVPDNDHVGPKSGGPHDKLIEWRCSPLAGNYSSSDEYKTQVLVSFSAVAGSIFGKGVELQVRAMAADVQSGGLVDHTDMGKGKDVVFSVFTSQPRNTTQLTKDDLKPEKLWNGRYITASYKELGIYCCKRHPVEVLAMCTSYSHEVAQISYEVLTFLNMVVITSEPIDIFTDEDFLKKHQAALEDLKRKSKLTPAASDRLKTLVEKISVFAGQEDGTLKRTQVGAALVECNWGSAAGEEFFKWGSSSEEKEVVEFLLDLDVTTKTMTDMYEREILETK
jgi:hypothetical protein